MFPRVRDQTPNFYPKQQQKQQLGVAEKGKVCHKVLNWILKGRPHLLMDFCELKRTHHQGGTPTSMEEGVWPIPGPAVTVLG